MDMIEDTALVACGSYFCMWEASFALMGAGVSNVFR